jgi:hypothetical protein
MGIRHACVGILAIGAGVVAAVTPLAQAPDPFNEQLLRPFTYRNLGPFRMGARTSDIAVPTAPRARSPVHLLRRILDRRPVEDHEQRHDVRAGLSTARRGWRLVT